MGSHEKLEIPTIEFTKITFLGFSASNCGMTEEEYQDYINEHGGDIEGIDALYGAGN